MAGNLFRRVLNFMPTPPAWSEVAPQGLYDVLWSYYHSNSLYENIQRYLDNQGVTPERIQPLRNPANRATEFYVSKIWPKELKIVTKNNSIREPLEQVWLWSNWDTQKAFVARSFAVTGDLFLQVVQPPLPSAFPAPVIEPKPRKTKIFFQHINPAHVTDFHKDARDYLLDIRIDIPITAPDGTQAWHTEAWTRFSHRVWSIQKKGTGEPLEKLGEPTMQGLLTELYNIDFIPIVHAKFKDVGNERGQGAYTHVIDKIDEANRIATRLHFLMYRYNAPMWAVTAGGADATGRPLPAPRLGQASTTNPSSSTLDVSDSSILRLPGNSDIKALVAGVDWGSHLKLLESHLNEITEDLPELAYYSLRNMTQISGRAVQYLLSDAIDRAELARTQLLAAFIKANQMAITMGLNVETFTGISGTYDDGDFQHTFEKEDIFPQSTMEVAEGERMEASAKVILNKLGVSRHQILTELGYDEETIKRMEGENKKELAENPPPAPDTSPGTAPQPNPQGETGVRSGT